MAGVTRIYSKIKVGSGDFDHIAFLLKASHDPKELFIFDATSGGIGYNKWSDLRDSIGPDKFYEKVVFRKINKPAEL